MQATRNSNEECNMSVSQHAHNDASQGDESSDQEHPQASQTCDETTHLLGSTKRNRMTIQLPETVMESRREPLCSIWQNPVRAAVGVAIVFVCFVVIPDIIQQHDEDFYLTSGPVFHRSQLKEDHASTWSPQIDRWSHATNNRRKLQRAMNSHSIEAIEADVLMGYDRTSSARRTLEPIMSHPPSRKSDLSVQTFLQETSVPLLATKTETNTTHQREDARPPRALTKHVKLDIKDMNAVLPVLELIDDLRIGHFVDSGMAPKRIFLNADVLRGPGAESKKPMDGDFFLGTCLDHLEKSVSRRDSDQKYSFSLGYTVDYHQPHGFTDDQVQRMHALTTKYRLNERPCCGLVLALNARILANRVEAFDGFLQDFPSTSILAWTGKGEPPIPFGSVQTIAQHFESMEWLHRIGFDVKLEDTEARRSWFLFNSA